VDLQRDQLDAQGRRTAARLAVRAGGPRAGAGGDRHRAGVAHLSVRHRDRAGRPRLDPAGSHRSGDRGRGRVLAAAVPGRAAAVTPGRRGRRLVRRGVHGDRPGGRLHPDGGRAGEYHARAPDARVPARHPRRRSRPGRRDRGVSAAVSYRGRDRNAAARPACRSGGRSLMKRVALYAAALGCTVFAGCPFYWMFVPFARLVSLLGLQDSLAALILIYPTMTIPFCTWLVMGFLRSVPWDIEEQAMIDGYSRLAVIVKVAPRLIVPGILTVIVFSF